MQKIEMSLVVVDWFLVGLLTSRCDCIALNITLY